MANKKFGSPRYSRKSTLINSFLISCLLLGVLYGVSHFFLAPKLNISWLLPGPMAFAMHGLVLLILSFFTKDDASLIYAVISITTFLLAGYLTRGVWGIVICLVIWVLLIAIPTSRRIKGIKTTRKSRTKSVVNQDVSKKPQGDYVDFSVDMAGDHPNGGTGQISYDLGDILAMGDKGLAIAALEADIEAKRLKVKERELEVRDAELFEARVRDRRATWERWLMEGLINQEEFNRKMESLGEEGLTVSEVLDLDEYSPVFEIDFGSDMITSSKKPKSQKSRRRIGRSL